MGAGERRETTTCTEPVQVSQMAFPEFPTEASTTRVHPWQHSLAWDCASASERALPRYRLKDGAPHPPPPRWLLVDARRQPEAAAVGSCH